jgi:adenylate kinase
MVKINNKKFDPFLTRTSINYIVDQIANKINTHDLWIKQPPILVVVLKGATTFATHLSEVLCIDVEIEYVRLSSYEGTQSSGKVIEVLGISRDISGRDIIIVEDIVETGLTIQHLQNYLISEKKVNSAKVCALFTRPKNYTCDVVVDFVGMELTNDEFIIGYGLDYNELGRNLKSIYKLVE